MNVYVSMGQRQLKGRDHNEVFTPFFFIRLCQLTSFTSFDNKFSASVERQQCLKAQIFHTEINPSSRFKVLVNFQLP